MSVYYQLGPRVELVWTIALKLVCGLQTNQLQQALTLIPLEKLYVAQFTSPSINRNFCISKEEKDASHCRRARHELQPQQRFTHLLLLHPSTCHVSAMKHFQNCSCCFLQPWLKKIFAEYDPLAKWCTCSLNFCNWLPASSRAWRSCSCVLIDEPHKLCVYFCSSSCNTEIITNSSSSSKLHEQMRIEEYIKSHMSQSKTHFVLSHVLLESRP